MLAAMRLTELKHVGCKLGFCEPEAITRSMIGRRRGAIWSKTPWGGGFCSIGSEVLKGKPLILETF